MRCKVEADPGGPYSTARVGEIDQFLQHQFAAAQHAAIAGRRRRGPGPGAWARVVAANLCAQRVRLLDHDAGRPRVPLSDRTGRRGKEADRNETPTRSIRASWISPSPPPSRRAGCGRSLGTALPRMGHASDNTQSGSRNTRKFWYGRKSCDPASLKPAAAISASIWLAARRKCFGAPTGDFGRSR